MKFTFAQSEMVKALSRVVGAVSTRMPMPSLSNLHLNLEKGRLEITATDLEVTVTARLDLAQSEGGGGFLVPAKRFQEIIRELSDVPLEMSVKDTRAVLSGEDVGRYDVPAGSPEDFPEIPRLEPKVKVNLNTATLKRMINRTQFAVSKDEMRPILTGFLVQLRSNEIRMVATDGHRLSRIIRRDVAYKGENRDVVVPAKAMNLALRNLSDDDAAVVGMAESRVSFTTDDYVLLSRLIEGNYPKYESVIPSGNPHRLTAKTEELMTAVRRVAVCASPVTHQLKMTLPSGGGGVRVKLESEDPEMGARAEVELTADYEGQAMEIAYNTQYLMDTLRQIDTEDVVMELAGPNDAAVVKPTVQAEGEDFLMLLMPIRLR